MNFNKLENINYSFNDYPVLIEYARLSSYPDFRALNHWHDDFEFTYIIDGQMNYNVNGTVIPLPTGTGIFINSKQMHFGFSKDRQDCLFLCIVFNPTLLCVNAALEEEYVTPIIASSHPFLKLSMHQPTQKKILAALLALRDSAQSKLLIQAKLFAIWHDLYQIFPKSPNSVSESNSDFSLLKAVLIFIESNYQKRLTLADLSEHFAVSKSKLIKLFHRYLQQTPIDYLNSFRIKKACQLLTTTELPITEISFNVGFNDSSYFAKTFKQKMRKTARQYRKEHTENN